MSSWTAVTYFAHVWAVSDSLGIPDCREKSMLDQAAARLIARSPSTALRFESRGPYSRRPEEEAKRCCRDQGHQFSNPPRNLHRILFASDPRDEARRKTKKQRGQ
jgi:hypothetical protein